MLKEAWLLMRGAEKPEAFDQLLFKAVIWAAIFAFAFFPTVKTLIVCLVVAGYFRWRQSKAKDIATIGGVLAYYFTQLLFFESLSWPIPLVGGAILLLTLTSLWEQSVRLRRNAIKRTFSVFGYFAMLVASCGLVLSDQSVASSEAAVVLDTYNKCLFVFLAARVLPEAVFAYWKEIVRNPSIKGLLALSGYFLMTLPLVLVSRYRVELSVEQHAVVPVGWNELLLVTTIPVLVGMFHQIYLLLVELWNPPPLLEGDDAADIISPWRLVVNVAATIFWFVVMLDSQMLLQILVCGIGVGSSLTTLFLAWLVKRRDRKPLWRFYFGP